MSDTSDLVELLVSFTPLAPVKKLIGLMAGARLEQRKDEQLIGGIAEAKMGIAEAGRGIANLRDMADEERRSHYRAAQAAVRQALNADRPSNRNRRLNDAIQELNLAAEREKDLSRAGVSYVLAVCFDMLEDKRNALEEYEKAYQIASRDKNIQYLVQIAPKAQLGPLSAKDQFITRFEEAQQVVVFLEQLAVLLRQRRSGIQTQTITTILAAHDSVVRGRRLELGSSAGTTPSMPSKSDAVKRYVVERSALLSTSEQPRDAAFTQWLGHVAGPPGQLRLVPRSLEQAEATAIAICHAIRDGRQPRWDRQSNESSTRIDRLARQLDWIRRTGNLRVGQSTKYAIAGDASARDRTPRLVLMIIWEKGTDFYIEIPAPVIAAQAGMVDRPPFDLHGFRLQAGAQPSLVNPRVTGSEKQIATLVDRILTSGLEAPSDYRLGLYRGER